MSSNRAWTGAEAWIFLSIGDAAGAGHAPLSAVIGAADSNNHAIPSVDEFVQAVGQLVGAGLVTTEPDKYGLTVVGQLLFDQINSPNQGHITRFVETARAWSKCAPSTADAVEWSVDAEHFWRAIEAYHEWFSTTWDKLRSPSNQAD